MRKALLILVIALIVIYGVAAIRGSRKLASASTQPWPDDLGSLASVRDRFPPQSANEAARKLTGLAAPLGIPFESRVPAGPAPPPTPYGVDVEAIGQYVKAEIQRGEHTIGEPPAAAAQFVATHATAIGAIRQLLLTEPVVWPRNVAGGYQAPTPNLSGHMSLTRVLATSALVRARAGDVGAWEDLQAAWNLSRSLHAHPEMVTQLIALAMARTINAVAWKLPAPAPPWRTQMDGVDNDRLLLRSLQYDKWLYWAYGMEAHANRPRGAFARVVEPLTRPFVTSELARMIDHERESARQLAAITECHFDALAFYRRRLDTLSGSSRREVSQMPTSSIDAIWERAFRYRAEREATRNALLLASGSPVDPRSRCSDGTWIVEGPTLRFSRPIPTAAGREAAMPLAVRVKTP